MNFVKMHGLGNDFVVVDGSAPAPSPSDVAAWCDRRRGIGADGVLRVTDDDGVAMEYWNADGSAAEMCGNGLRCVARFAVDRGMVDGASFSIRTAVGDREVEVRDDGTVRARLGAITEVAGGPLQIAGYTLEPVGVGNPHAVAIVDDCYSVPVEAVGPIVEGDPHFPDRTNVEFATVVSRERINLRVWERGVGETLACGTGAAAAAAVAHARGLTDASVVVMLPGGPLGVELVGDDVWIDGPATVSFAGSI